MRIAPTFLLAGLLVSGAQGDSPESLPPEPAMNGWTMIASGLSFPEGPAWDGGDTLYFSNCNGGSIGRVRLGVAETFIPAEGQPSHYERTNGLAFASDGFLYACEWGKEKGGIHRISTEGQIEVYANRFEGRPFARPNDLASDPNGNLYFTDPNSYDASKPDGFLYRVDRASGEVRRATAEGFSFCNGLAFTADGRHLMLAESARSRVLRLPVLEDGSLGPAEPFAEMPGGDPDGMNFDTAGNLYVAHFGGGAVWVIGADGTVREKIATPGRKPSNVEFGGPDLRTLFLTEDETEAVYTRSVEAPGLPLFFHPARNEATRR